MAHYLMQAKDSTTQAVTYWPSATRDHTGADYPGPGLPLEAAVYGILPGDLQEGVISFAGRDGVVMPASGDYDAALVDFDPSATLSVSTDVQEALEDAMIASTNSYDDSLTGIGADNVQSAIAVLATATSLGVLPAFRVSLKNGLAVGALAAIPVELIADSSQQGGFTILDNDNTVTVPEDGVYSIHISVGSVGSTGNTVYIEVNGVIIVVGSLTDSASGTRRSLNMSVNLDLLAGDEVGLVSDEALTTDSNIRLSFSMVKQAVQLPAPPVLGRDLQFHDMAGTVNTAAGTWETVDSVEVTFAGGQYLMDLTAIFNGSTVNDSYQLRWCISGVPTGDPVSFEPKAVDDTYTHASFNLIPIPAGTYTLDLQGQCLGAGAHTLTVTEHRFKMDRISL